MDNNNKEILKRKFFEYFHQDLAEEKKIITVFSV